MLQTQIRRSKSLSLAKCNSSQGKQQSTADSLLKLPAQTPTSFREFIWIKAELKLFWDFVPESFILSAFTFAIWWTHLKEINTSILDFFTTQLSWFHAVANNKMHFEKECFEVLTISFFSGICVPLSGVSHSPSWLVPFLPERGGLWTSYQDFFCPFNLYSPPINNPSNPTLPWDFSWIYEDNADPPIPHTCLGVLFVSTDIPLESWLAAGSEGWGPAKDIITTAWSQGKAL